MFNFVFNKLSTSLVYYATESDWSSFSKRLFHALVAFLLNLVVKPLYLS